MLECSFISPAPAVVIVPLALLTMDRFVNYASTLAARSYGHDIVSQVRSVCHLLPDVMETLMMITSVCVKPMFDMNKIFSSPPWCLCECLLLLTALPFLWPFVSTEQIPCSSMRVWLSWIQYLDRLSWILNSAQDHRAAPQRKIRPAQLLAAHLLGLINFHWALCNAMLLLLKD